MNFKHFMLRLAAVSIMAQPVPVLARDAAPVPQPGPSVFVRCDGNPNKPSTLDTVARLVAITAVVGLLLPQRESPDPKQRANGADGIAACTAALEGEGSAKDGGRRIELFFGRAIHKMEVADWDGAIADIRAIEVDQPTLTAMSSYKLSLGVTALNLEAMAQVGKGDLAGAETTAMRMFDSAPYDLRAVIRSIDYTRLLAGYGEAKQRYFARAVQVYPTMLKDRAEAFAGVRRFADAARDYESFNALVNSVPMWREGPNPFAVRAAIAWRLSGDKAAGDRLVVEQKALVTKAVRDGKSDDTATGTATAIDFYTIISELEDGSPVRARTLFSAHSNWGYLPVGFVVELSRRLSNVGTPAEQAANPITSPEQIEGTAREAAVGVINNTKDRFALYRIAFGPGAFGKFAKNVWRTDKSRYLGNKPAPELLAYPIDVLRDGDGYPAGYALLLHAALLAKAYGVDGFMLMPNQKFVYSHFVRFGNKIDESMIPAVMFDPNQVIADLGPYFPKPEQAR